jgi:hypothetical protein
MSETTGKFNLTHVFATVAITVVTAVVTGYLIDPSILAYSHFSEAGLAQTQITQSLLGSFNAGISDFMMTILDPIRESLNITAQFTGQTASGANIIANGASAVSAGSASALGAGLGLGNVPTMGN